MDDVPARWDFAGAPRRRFVAGERDRGSRLDQFLSSHLAGFSRAAVQRLIHEEHVRLDGGPARSATRLRPGQTVEVEVPRVLPPRVDPEAIPLQVLVEDADFAAIAKPPGLAVHPGRGRLSGTLANAIAHRWGVVAVRGGAYRPGIVHRLDLETSGVIVIAKTEAAHERLSLAFRRREVAKIYRALVFGDPAYDEDRIDLPLGRDLFHPTRMAVRHDGGREACTLVKVLERFGAGAHVECRPETGRTHQIRVHLQQRGTPILGDRTYARGRTPPVPVPRLMLHAWRLTFPHPASGEPLEVEAPLPEDFLAVRASLRSIDGGESEG